MESDDGYQSLSPQTHHRRLKRLKKFDSKTSNDPLFGSFDDPLPFPQVDFAKLEALENGTGSPDLSDDSDSTEEAILSRETLSQGFDNEREMENEGKMENGSDGEVKKAKRVLEFDDGEMGGADEDVRAVGEGSEGFDPEKKGVKDRKACLKELRAESQRLLRETRDASFKPVPVVQKPISSILEKILKRKLAISKIAIDVNDKGHDFDNRSPKNKRVNLDICCEENNEENVGIILEKEMISPSLYGGSSLAPCKVDECKAGVKSTAQESDQQLVDLFDDLETVGTSAELNDKLVNSPMEEDLVPLRAMNLKFDSASVDSSSSDEDYNDKENVEPHPLSVAYGSMSGGGDFAQDFIDDEADEEDDSDNDLLRFQENEVEDFEDLKELNDMIATENEERPADNENRNKLHQKWLEQQDATGTENLMQKLQYGQGLRGRILLGQESETDEEDEEFDDEAKEEFHPRNSSRINTKKAKQIIMQLLPDKEDAYLSDEDNNTQSRHALSLRKEKQAAIVSPAADESSKEVFGLIKKLNITPKNKRKPKAVSFFDSVLRGGNNDSSSKSSFLGRASDHSISSSRKQGTGAVRSFIFGRDNSNSRSALSMSGDSSDTVSQEARPMRIATAKYSNSQTEPSQSRDAAIGTSSRTSLLETLKRPSSLSNQVGNQDTTVDLMKGIFYFRALKNPTKIEGRS